MEKKLCTKHSFLEERSTISDDSHAYRGSPASEHSRTSTRAERRATASEATQRRPRHAKAAARSAAGSATVTMVAEAEAEEAEEEEEEEEEEAEEAEEEEAEEEAEVEMVGGTRACTMVSTLAAIGFEADAAAAGQMLQTQRFIDENK